MVHNLPHERRRGIHAGRDIKVTGSGIVLAGGDVYIGQLVQGADVPTPIGLLPRDIADFTGREDELEQLQAELLSDDGQALIISAIHGKPGVGKSALAIHLAHLLAEQFSDGQVYVNLRGADQEPLPTETVLTELLHVLGVPGDQQPASLDGKAALWRQQVAARRVLVVLDNVHDEAQVHPLLPGSSTCAVIITSRAALTTLGAQPLLLDILDSEQALELLSKIAGPKRIKKRERQAAQAVAAACGGLPLALQIAGARLAARPDWRVEQLAARLADERRRLAQLGVGNLDVRTSFHLSYQELGREQARLFSLLSLWPGVDFQLWVPAVLRKIDSDEAEALVDGLVDAQLVEPAQVPGRFQMHDLLRLFAHEQLSQDIEIDLVTARTRLMEAAIWLTHSSVVALEPQGLFPGCEKHDHDSVKPAVALAWLEAERQGLVALTADAVEQRSWHDVTQLAEQLSEFLDLRGYWSEWEQVARWALHAAQEVGDRAAEGRALINLANVLDNRGHWKQAHDHLENSLTIFRELGDRHGEATALRNLGFTLDRQSHWEQAIDCFRQSLAISREVGDRRGEGGALGGLGSALNLLGDWEQAIDCFRQSLAISREVGDRRGEAGAFGSLGDIYDRKGDFEQAIDHYQEAMTISRELGYRRDEASALGSLGNIYDRKGDFEQALDQYEQTLAVSRDLGDRHGEAMSLINLGIVRTNLGQWDEAIDFDQQGLALSREISDQHGEAFALISLGTIHDYKGDYDQAIEHYQRSLTIFRELGDRHGQAVAMGNLGKVTYREGRLEQAIEHHQRSLTILRELGDRRREAEALGDLASLYYHQGLFEQAINHCQQCLALSRELGDGRLEAQALIKCATFYRKNRQWRKVLACMREFVAILRSADVSAAEMAQLFRPGDLRQRLRFLDRT